MLDETDAPDDIHAVFHRAPKATVFCNLYKRTVRTAARRSSARR